MMAVAMASNGEFQIILHWFEMNLFRLGDLYPFQLSAWLDVRKWCALCWLQLNDTAVHTAISITAELHWNPAAESSAVRRIGLGLFSACNCACWAIGSGQMRYVRRQKVARESSLLTICIMQYTGMIFICCVLGCVVKQLFVEDHEENTFFLCA